MRIGLALINLDRDVGRLDHMRGQIERLGLIFERFPAVLGLQVPDWAKSWFFLPDGTPVHSLKPGEIGVYASHISLHRMLLARADIDALLVMEDDLEIADDLPAVLAGIAGFDVPFDIIKLSNPAKAPYLAHGEVAPGRELATYARVPNNLGAYVISKAGAAKTTAFHGLRRFAIDEDMRRPWDWGLETFGVLPAPIRANIFELSSIDAMGDRNLGRESWLDKLKRRRIGSPRDWLKQVRWQIAHLGAAGYAAAILRGVVYSVAKRVSAKPEACLRMRGRALVER